MAGEAKAVLKKKKKPTDLEEKVEEIESLIEEEEPSEEENVKALLNHINTVLEALLKAAEESEDELILHEIRDDVKELKEKITEGSGRDILESIEKRLSQLEESLERKVSLKIEDLQRENEEFLTQIKRDLNYIRDGVNDLLKEEEERLKALEKELETIKSLVNGIHTFLDGDLEKRHEFLVSIRRDLEELERELKELSQSVADQSRAESLLSELKDTKDSILYALAKLEDMESRNAEAIVHSLDELREEVLKISQELNSLESSEKFEGEKIKELEERLNKAFKRLKVLVKVTSKNAHFLENYGGELAALLASLHTLETKVKDLAKMEEKWEEAQKEYMQKLFEHLDESLAEVSKRIGDLILEGMRSKDKSLDEHIRSLEDSLKEVHSELANLLLLLKERDPTSELKELEEQMKVLSERVAKGIMDKKEIREILESMEKRLDEVESAIPSEDLQSLKKSLKDVEETVNLIEKKVESAGAVISKEDLKEILKEIEELRLQARLLKVSGVGESLEELSKKVEEFKKELDQLPEEAVHVGEDLKRVEELLGEVVKLASQVEVVAREKAKSSQKMAEYAESIGEHAGVVGSHIIKKKSSELKKKSRLMMEVANLARKISKKTKQIGTKLEEKRITAKIEVSDPRERVKKVLLTILKSMKPGEVLDLSKFAKERGYSEKVVRDVAQEIVRVGEIAVKLEKPFVPFLGSWKLRRM